jgi:hypothetical protein
MAGCEGLCHHTPNTRVATCQNSNPSSNSHVSQMNTIVNLRKSPGAQHRNKKKKKKRKERKKERNKEKKEKSSRNFFIACQACLRVDGDHLQQLL